MCCSCKMPNHPLRLEGEDLLLRARLLQPMRHLGQINDGVQEGHRQIRRAERAAALGFEFAPGAELPAEVNFEQARRHAIRAREDLRLARDSDEWTAIRRGFDAASDEFGTTLSEARAMLTSAVDRGDLSVADSTETFEIWDRVVRSVRDQGVDGLFDLVDGQLAEFDKVLTDGRNWGREPHSPFEWWQWLIIIGILAIFVGALIVCLWWFGCSWISAIWAAFCAGSVAAGGWWAGICLGFGF
jgi:hypothetical protein